MAQVSKTARAAIQAGGNVVVVPKVTRTPEQMIQEIRNLRAGNLFVSNMEYVDVLLRGYDIACEQVNAFKLRLDEYAGRG